LIICRLMVLSTVAVVTVHAGQAFAQGGFPAPLPGQSAPPNASPFPPVTSAAQSSFPPTASAPIAGPGFQRPMGPTSQAAPPDDCMAAFVPLREEAERRGKLIKAASERHAQPDEACKLFGNYSQAEIKMIKYIDSHAAKCGIPQQVSDQLKNNHKGTEAMQKKVCGFAQQQQQRGPAGPSLSEVLGSPASVPEATAAKKGGSTFDTLNGNVLAR
jgi:hypothetical protein